MYSLSTGSARALLTEANERYQSEVVAHGQDLEQLKMFKNELAALQATVASVKGEVNLHIPNWGRSRALLRARERKH